MECHQSQKGDPERLIQGRHLSCLEVPIYKQSQEYRGEIQNALQDFHTKSNASAGIKYQNSTFMKKLSKEPQAHLRANHRCHKILKSKI